MNPPAFNPQSNPHLRAAIGAARQAQRLMGTASTQTLTGSSPVGTFTLNAFPDGTGLVPNALTGETDYTGVFDAITEAVKMLMAGYEQNAAFYCVTTMEQFSTPPVERQGINYTGTAYRIRGISQDGLHYKFTLYRPST